MTKGGLVVAADDGEDVRDADRSSLAATARWRPRSTAATFQKRSKSGRHQMRFDEGAPWNIWIVEY